MPHSGLVLVSDELVARFGRLMFVRNLNKYKLSLMDSRDGIVLRAELDDYCDKRWSACSGI